MHSLRAAFRGGLGFEAFHQPPEAFGGHQLAAPVQRKAIDGERQYFTFRQTRRTVPMTFSMILVQASDCRSSGGNPSHVTVSISSSPSSIDAETPFQSFSSRRARLRRSCSALSASSISQACRRTRLTWAWVDLDRRSMMLRALWI